MIRLYRKGECDMKMGTFVVVLPNFYVDFDILATVFAKK